jgi:photosystem II stability/assembly factor-like uncharacterized protein
MDPVLRGRPTVLTAALSVLLATVPAFASPPPAIDPTRCRVSPAGTVTQEGNVLTVTVRPDGVQMGQATLRFAEPVPLADAERLVLGMRGEEATRTYLCIARIAFLGTNAAQAEFEPDVLVPVTWAQRDILLRDMKSPPPPAVAAVQLHFWSPESAGGEIRLHIRRLQFQSRADLAAETRPGSAARAPLPVRRAAGGGRWTNIGPGGGGWFRTVAISPHDGTCFVGGDVGGVYRTRDRGRTWETRNDDLPNLYINCFAFHPADPKIVYAGGNGGPLKSVDGGDTWRVKRAGLPQVMTFGLSAPVSAMLVDRADPRRVWAGVGREREFGKLDDRTPGGRVLISDDAGESWRPVLLPPGPGVASASALCLRQHPADPAILFAVTPAGLYRSADRGETWLPWGAGTGGHKLCFLEVRRDRPDTLLMSFHEGPGGGAGGVLISTDGGRAWTPSCAGLPTNDRTAWRLAAAPDDPARFYLGYRSHSGLYTTSDGGVTWRRFGSVRDTQWTWAFAHTIATGLDVDPADPRRVVICDDVDILQTADGGATWASVIADAVTPATPDRPATWRGRGCEILCLTGPQAIAVDPSRPQTVFAGYWDLHAWRTDDGGGSFARMENGTDPGFGRMGAVLLDPANPDVLWISVGRNEDRQRLYRSVDGGRSFRLAGHEGSGLPPGGIFTLVLDPSSPPQSRTLYAGVTRYGVYRSDDGGLTWSPRNDGLPEDSRTIRQIAMDPRNPRRLVAAAGGQAVAPGRGRANGYLAVSDDGGAHWRIARPDVEAQCVIADPAAPGRFHAGNRNYSGVDVPNALYRSDDGGATWTATPQDVFAAGPGPSGGDHGWRCYVSCLAADPTTPGLLYAGLTSESYDQSNGRGVFVSRDHGATWQPLPHAGLHNRNIGTIVVDPVNPSRLYVGTGGNGLFRWDGE